MPNTTPTESFWKNIHLLIVDDEQDMREIFAAWFRNLGCRVTEACDGAEALEACSKGVFDAVISDVRMPRVDGIELAKNMQTTYAHTPVVIFVSGFNDMLPADAYDLGIECLLSKPCERKRLIEALRVCLQREREGFVKPLREGLEPTERIERDFANSLEGAGAAIGRGGISLPSTTDLGGDTVASFSLKFSAGDLSMLRGTGIVRWSEYQGGLFRLGIEFNSIAADSAEDLRRYLEEHKPAQFIPKGVAAAHSA